MSTRLPAEVAAIVEALSGLKGQEIVVLDLRGMTDATDWFVVASGTSDTHVRGLADAVTRTLQPMGYRPHHAEGLTQGRWVLLDFVDVVVHLFHPEARAFYRLERLWGDAPMLRTG